MDQLAARVVDIEMMKRCIELSKLASAQGELPFACLIYRHGHILVQATNRVFRDADTTRHAELVALSETQRLLDTMQLTNCTMYTNVEPCPMCSFAIREIRIERVVYSIKSPLMGGHSRWNVLGDDRICNVVPEVFGEVPEIVAGVLVEEAESIWRDWNPDFWNIIKSRGCLGEPGVFDGACRSHALNLDT
jgi:tRNA(adenine34) deaminase